MSQRPHLSCYQWEGIYTADFTLDGIMRRCQQLTEVLIARKWSCLVAYDTRFMAGHFAHYVYNRLTEQGVQVSFCSTPAPFPTVELALSQKRADTALIISASNRQFWYNGIIMLAPPDAGALMDAQLPPPVMTDLNLPFPSPSLDIVEPTQIDLRAPYLEML